MQFGKIRRPNLTKKQWIFLGIVIAGLIAGILSIFLYQKYVAGKIETKSVRHFNTYFEQEEIDNAFLITAMDPDERDAQTPKLPKFLPLSQHQKYLIDGKHPWGDDVHYADLISDYRVRLEKGEKVYISNAKVNEDPKIAEDFAKIQKEFKVIQISNDCGEECNIYRVMLQ